MTNQDIIIVGQQAWDINIGSNCKDIALEFSRNNRVLYVNPPLDRISNFRGKKDEAVKKRIKIIKGKQSALVKIQENLWNLYPDRMIESINWIRNENIYNFLNKINNKRLAKSIIVAIELLKFKNFLLFNDGDMFRSFYLIELIRPAVSVYYSRDFLLATDYYKFHGARLEPQLIKKNMLCVANSIFLSDYCKKYNQNSFYVGQGCSPLFAENIAVDIKDISRPVIGYVGALLSSRLSLEVLLRISHQKPEWQIVLVGPEDEKFTNSELHHLPNVHFTGAKIPSQLADFINGFDVCINPQELNALTMGNYPRKVDEYLSLGKPVVATFTKAMEVFKDHVYLANSPDEFVQLIDKALREDSAEKRKQRVAFSSTHTWENSVNEIYNAVKQVKNDLPKQ